MSFPQYCHHWVGLRIAVYVALMRELREGGTE